MSDVPSAYWACPDSSVLAVGPTSMWNGLAFSAYQTWAFRRAELTCFAESPFFCGNGERATMGLIRTLPPRAHGAERLIAILQRLWSDLSPSLLKLPKGARVGLVLCLSERFAEGAASEGMRAQRRRIEAALTELTKPLEMEWTIRLETRGHASLAYALREVAPALLAHRFDALVVGGVDSAYDPEVVETLIEEERLFDGEDLDTVIPGEGGAFCVLAAPEVIRRAGWDRGAELEGVAVASEPSPLGSGAPCQALGATRAMNLVVEPLRARKRKVDWWLADVTPERYRTDEWLLAFPRASGDVSGPRSSFDLLPVLLGDLGAATLPTMLALASEAMRRGDPDAETCVLSASSVTQDRGAILVSLKSSGRDEPAS